MVDLRATKKRTERVEFRLTPAERATIEAAVIRTRRTATSLFCEWVETLDKENNSAK